jgi:NitT/TauT family transport system substrate-binding protein
MRLTHVPVTLLRFATAALVLMPFIGDRTAAAEPIKIGLIKLPSSAPIFIALDKGYFAAEGLDPSLVYFDSGQSIAVAVAGRAIDFGAVGLSAALYNLAGQGALRIIAGAYNEMPGFPDAAVLVSTRAYASGLTSMKALAGHSVATTTVGSPLHYGFELIAEKYGFDIKTLRVLPTQSIPNEISALTGGEADASLIAITPAIPPLIERGEIKQLGWLGDAVSMQFGASFTSGQTADQRHELVERFIRALRKGAKDHHDAFTGADGKRHDQASAPEMLAIIAKYTAQPVEHLKDEVAYVDPEERLDVKDVEHQIAWYQSEGLVKREVDPAIVVDKRYVVPMTAPAMAGH